MTDNTHDDKRAAAEPPLFNALPHATDIELVDGTRMHIEKSGVVLRLTEAPPQELGEAAGGVRVIAPPVYTGIEGDVDAIPAGAGVLVSALVGEYVRTNGVPPALATHALYAPATGPDFAVRTATGAITGTKALVRYTL
jgi:hypothetical protein